MRRDFFFGVFPLLCEPFTSKLRAAFSLDGVRVFFIIHRFPLGAADA